MFAAANQATHPSLSLASIPRFQESLSFEGVERISQPLPFPVGTGQRTLGRPDIDKPVADKPALLQLRRPRQRHPRPYDPTRRPRAMPGKRLERATIIESGSAPVHSVTAT